MTLLSFLGSVEILILLGVLICTLILPVIALVDILKGKFNGDLKLIWILVVILVPIMGSVLYLIIGRKQKINNALT